jgi:hypothetical protein
MNNSRIIATNHANGEIRIWSMKYESWMDLQDEIIIKSNLKFYIDNETNQPCSTITDYKILDDTGYPQIANKE